MSWHWENITKSGPTTPSSVVTGQVLVVDGEHIEWVHDYGKHGASWEGPAGWGCCPSMSLARVACERRHGFRRVSTPPQGSRVRVR